MLNGALTIGTLDGANIEMREECGAENIYTFGFTVEQVQRRRQQGYNPHDDLKNEELRLAIDQIRDGYFSPDDRSRFDDIIDRLLTGGDYWMVLGDYQSYIDKQREVSRDFLNPRLWYSKCVHNIAGASKFSSDRTIEQYANDIWFEYDSCRKVSFIDVYRLGIVKYMQMVYRIISKKNYRKSIMENQQSNIFSQLFIPIFIQKTNEQRQSHSTNNNHKAKLSIISMFHLLRMSRLNFDVDDDKYQ
jgi:hypothetical protein